MNSKENCLLCAHDLAIVTHLAIVTKTGYPVLTTRVYTAPISGPAIVRFLLLTSMFIILEPRIAFSMGKI